MNVVDDDRIDDDDDDDGDYDYNSEKRDDGA